MGFGVRVSALVAAAALLGACAGSGEGLDENGRPLSESAPSGPFVASIESIQEHVFDPACISCHSGALARNNLRLDDAQTSYDNLVGVPATEFPAALRVAAGNPDDSYLVHKLEGTQEVGERMPLNGPYLSEETMAVIRQWIADGAAPPGSGEPPQPSFFLPASFE